MEARVCIAEDECLIEWFDGAGPAKVILSFQDEKFGYAILDGEQYRPGKHDKWVDAAGEIAAATATRIS